MIENFEDVDVKVLRDHLKAIVEVEFFTIPVYLTAVYSFTDRALKYSTSPGGSIVFPLFELQQEALSVAVQEMYHLQLACNIANAFDTTPEIPKMSFQAGKRIRAPHLDPNGEPLELQLGTLRDMIEAAIELEGPDTGEHPQPNSEVEYPSIDDLYFATLILLQGYMGAFRMKGADDPNMTMDNKQVAFTGFSSQYRFNTISKKKDVITAANAIVDQGEGNDLTKLLSGTFEGASTDFTVLPQFRSEGSRFDMWNAITHFARFSDVQKTLNGTDWEREIGGPVFYDAGGKRSDDLPDWAPSYETLQDSANSIWSYLVDCMQEGFASGNLDPNYSPEGDGAPGFCEAMITFKYVLPLIWQHGHCPSLLYVQGVTGNDAQAAMDAVDPLCLYHWDAASRQVRHTFPRNSCQGLNECAGQGWGGIATRSGDGACATADFHTCGSNNSCRLEGGCGFLVSAKGEACGASVAQSQAQCGEVRYPPPWVEWAPGSNQCGGMGGCQTPISTEQVFNRNARAQIDHAGPNPPWDVYQKERLEHLMGTNVWARARELFERRIDEPLPEPRIESNGSLTYDGAKRRNAIEPTSK